MSEWDRMHDSPMPYQTVVPFPPEAIVLVRNAYGDRRIDLCKNLWWGYTRSLLDDESVIVWARRLDRPKVNP